MSRWTHSICDDDWDKLNPDRPSLRIGAGEFETCCFCGEEHWSGIYIRQVPAGLLCGGDHKKPDSEARL